MMFIKYAAYHLQQLGVKKQKENQANILAVENDSDSKVQENLFTSNFDY